MKFIFRIFSILIILPIFVYSQNSGYRSLSKESLEIIKALYQYYAAQPLDQRSYTYTSWNGYATEKVIYTTTNLSRIPGKIAFPNDNVEKHPCIILVHGIGGRYSNWFENNPQGLSLSEVTKKLLDNGYAVFAFDEESGSQNNSGSNLEASINNFRSENINSLRQMLIQTTLDVRRAIDYLSTRSDINLDKIGLIGYSFAGIVTYLSSAMDERLKVAISCVAPPYDATFKNYVGWDNEIAQSFLAADVRYFAPHIKTSFLYMIGTQDPFYSAAEARKLFNSIASQQKQIKEYNSGHILPKEFADDILAWLRNNL